MSVFNVNPWNFQETLRNAKQAQQSMNAPQPSAPTTPATSTQETPTQTIPGTGYLKGAAGEWENALGAHAAQLQQPVNNPDFQPMIDYLRKYFQQLQGPAYTPAQMDLLQTQATQPLEEQRAAAKQQAIQRLAAHGINPGSGVVEKALEEIDRSFNQMRTGQQAQFASNAVNLDRQNAATAAQVGQTTAGIQNQQQQLNEQRGGQAVNLLGQIPQYADQQTNQAMQWLNMYNPGANNPFNLNQQQNMQNQQNSQAWQQGLMQALSMWLGNGSRTGNWGF